MLTLLEREHPVASEGPRGPVSPKRVLMVSYHYPPDGSSSGVLRPLKFTKYLPGHGWTPHVLTVKESMYATKDVALAADISAATRVHRTFGLDTTRHLAVKGRYLGLLAVPDRLVGWLPFAIVRGRRVIETEGIQAIYSTSPPATTHLIACALKMLTGRPWVADFRDPWIEEDGPGRPGSVRYRVESALERLVIRRADVVLVTTPYLRADLLARYPELPAAKVRVIYNGYDESDFAALADPARGGHFEIVHAGLMPREFRDPFPLLRAVADLIRGGAIGGDDVRVSFLGAGPYASSDDFARRVTQLGLDRIVRVEPRMPYAEALRRLRQASVLLVLQASNDTRSLIPAKAFEYLRLDRPIVALTLPGATADLLDGMDSCYVVNPADDAALRWAVASLYGGWRRASDDRGVRRPIQHFERNALTADLARLLDGLVTSAAATSCAISS